LYQHILTSIVAVLFKLISSSAWSSEIELKTVYQVQWNDMAVATAEAKWVFTENSYLMSGTAQTVGILNKLKDFKGTSLLLGKVASGAFQPLRLHIASISDYKKKQAETDWYPQNGIIKTLRYPDIDEEKVYPLRQKLITNSIDPFSAMLNTLEKIRKTGKCTSKYRIYDGLRTAILSFHDMGEQYLIKDRPFAFAGSTIKCRVESKPTGGHQIKNRWIKKNREKDNVIGFISEVKPGLFIPVRIELATPVGKIISRLHMPSLTITDL